MEESGDHSHRRRVSVQLFPIGHLSRSRYVLYRLCNVEEASLSLFITF